MTGKSACGNCGSESGCGCHTPNPYQQGVEVVWHDPTTYDVRKHGPSFLPKLASTQKAEVRAFVRKQAAFYDTGLMAAPRQAPAQALPWVLSYLRSLAHVHQTHHWQTRGQAFYADHLLFERLYNESLEFIDQVAERAVGTFGASTVKAHEQIDSMHEQVKMICGGDEGGDSPDLMVEHSLRGEVMFLAILDGLLKTQPYSPGTKNLLEGVGDKHEAFVYLLKQRLGGGPTAYSYDRS